MKKLIFIIFIIASNLAFNQEICDNGIDDDFDGLIDLNDTTDCACEGFESSQVVPSLIPNSSFENRSCCPNTFSQLNCADTWIQASNATSDYYNTCGFTNIGSFNAPPNPLPDGNGYVGFYNGNGAGAEANYKEYVGACLLSPMLAGNTYTLQFNMSHAGGNLTTDISIFGTIDCANLPFGGANRLFGCPLNGPGWTELATTSVTFNNSWNLVTLTFTPTQNINAVAIGGNCTPVAGPTSYYYADNLILAETSGFGSINIVKTGSFCSNDVLLTATADTTGTWQWFKEGVAIVGETTSSLNISANNLGTGKYSIRLTNGIKCEISDFNLDSNYIAVNVFNDSICANLNSGEIEVFNVTGENVAYPLQYFIDGTGPFIDSVFRNLAPGTYQIVVRDTNQCTDTNSVDVVGLLVPQASIEADTVCIGGTTSFTNNSTGAITNATWSFGDGTFSNQNTPTVQHQYVTNGIYMAKLVTETSQGCKDSMSIQVVVQDMPIVDFTFVNDCELKTIQFNNTTAFAGSSNTNSLIWDWNFGNTNTSTSKNPTQNYTSAGFYDVTLSVSSLGGCSADTIKQIEIYPNPSADFIALPVCLGEVTQINDLSVVSSGTITSWNYQVGDVNYTVQNPMHQFATSGSINVKLKVSTINGCEDSIIKPIVTYPLPVANFDISPLSLNIFQTEACFDNLSEGATIYFWDYGFLNRTSIVSQECIKYPTDIPGFYDVFLRATNQFGCVDSITKTIEIQEVFIIYVPNSFTPDGDGKNDIFMPVVNGAKSIDFYIFDRWGEQFFYTNKIGAGWDGTNNSEELSQQDTYVYRISVIDIYGKKHIRQGHVNLVK